MTRERPAAGRVRLRGLSGLLAEFVLTFTGFFALLPVLPVLLRDLGALSAVEVGTVLMVFTVAAKAGSLLLVPVLHRMRQSRVLFAAPALTAVCSLGLVLGPPFPVLVVCLAGCGLGVSVNGLVVRIFLAASLPSDDQRMRSFGLLNVCLNAAATVGPMLGTTLYDPAAPRLVLGAIGICFLLAVVAATGMLVARSGAPDARVDGGKRFSAREFVGLLRGSGELRRVLVVNVLGWIMYAQLLSALPLFLFDTVGRQSLIGSVYLLGAVLVVVCQLPVTAALSRHVTPADAQRLLLVGLALFPLSFLLIGGSEGRLVMLYAAITVFTAGEILFTPLVDTSLARSGEAAGYVAVFTGKQMTVAVGESLGAFLGGSGFLALSAALDSAGAYWFVAAGVGMFAVLLTAVASARTAPQYLARHSTARRRGTVRADAPSTVVRHRQGAPGWR